MALGGLPDLHMGKTAERHIHLDGAGVSRAHARLTRLDFGPSRWQITDTQSRNGVFINDQPVAEAELHDGDKIQIGEFELQYLTRVPQPVARAPGENQVRCPSCWEIYAAKTPICVACGINIKTGRPLVTSRELDENEIAIRTDTWVRFLSWVIWFGLFPIASEAFGTKRAITIWWLSGVTIFFSFVFFIPFYSHGIFSDVCRPWMMWVGTPDPLPNIVDSSPNSRNPTQELIRKVHAIQQRRAHLAGTEHFEFHQLFTNLFIHAGVMHLAGNMIFMLVFGIRVNELIGNIKMAIIYPVLGLCADLIFMYSARNGPLTPSLGASGAIMGLAGMYFVFFPVQKVHMIIWLRGGLFTGWRVLYKIFRMSGFWLLFLWVGINDVLPTMLHGSQTISGVAHWAHLGGFISGFGIAVGLLLTRQVNAHGSDLLSMILGPAAWRVIGRPSTRPS